MNDPLDFDHKTSRLGDLTHEQLDYVALGMMNAFEADLSRPPEAKGLFVLETETGDKHGLHPSLTVATAWKIAERTANGGTPPAVFEGAVDILHNPALN